MHALDHAARGASCAAPLGAVWCIGVRLRESYQDWLHLLSTSGYPTAAKQTSSIHRDAVLTSALRRAGEHRFPVANGRIQPRQIFVKQRAHDVQML